MSLSIFVPRTPVIFRICISLDDRSSLFTGALYDMTYGPPQGFCFECNGIVPVKVSIAWLNLIFSSFVDPCNSQFEFDIISVGSEINE